MAGRKEGEGRERKEEEKKGRSFEICLTPSMAQSGHWHVRAAASHPALSMHTPPQAPVLLSLLGLLFRR